MVLTVGYRYEPEYRIARVLHKLPGPRRP